MADLTTCYKLLNSLTDIDSTNFCCFYEHTDLDEKVIS